MSEPNQEPTMEEILASIRRIISEDEAPADAAAEEAAPEDEEEAPAMEALDEPAEFEAAPAEDVAEDDVLELTERIGGPEPAESHGDIDVYPAEPEPAPRAAAADLDDEGPLLGAAAAASASSAFGQLARTIAMPADGRTLEDVVRELLRPLLKAWLDENLPAIVQARVDAEVERISRAYRG
jgi:cell pole-organizing protein PopZ